MNSKQPPFYFRGRPPMGMPVRTIRCEGDIDAAATALLKGEDFVPRFFSEQTYAMYTQTVVGRIIQREQQSLLLKQEEHRNMILEKMGLGRPQVTEKDED